MDKLVTDLVFLVGFSLTFGVLFIRTFLHLLTAWNDEDPDSIPGKGSRRYSLYKR